MRDILHSLLALLGKLFGANKLNILIYHQVFQQRDEMRPSEPDLATFRWQMSLVKKYYTPLSISDALRLLAEGNLPKNAICITFDDGYLNNLTVAAPVLAELNIPATVYVATGFSDGENMWNDRILDLCANKTLSALNLSSIGEGNISLTNIQSRINAAHFLITQLKYLPFTERKEVINKLYQVHNAPEHEPRMMTSAQIQSLSELGVDIGAHTVDHPILKVLSAELQEQQMLESKRSLEEWLGKPVTGFAYPNGKYQSDYDENTRDIAKKVGFDYVVSTNWGVSTKNTDKWQLNRFTPWDSSPLTFHLRMLRNCLGW